MMSAVVLLNLRRAWPPTGSQRSSAQVENPVAVLSGATLLASALPYAGVGRAKRSVSDE